jgi:hypothetical protein
LTGKNVPITFFQIPTPIVIESAQPGVDLGRVPLTVGGRFGHYGLKCALHAHQPCALFQQFLFELRHMGGVVVVDQRLYRPSSSVFGLARACVHALGNLGAAAFDALQVELREIPDAHVSAEHPDVFAVVLDDLIRIAHLAVFPTKASKNHDKAHGSTVARRETASAAVPDDHRQPP